jgi:hypothetical protein
MRATKIIARYVYRYIAAASSLLNLVHRFEQYIPTEEKQDNYTVLRKKTVLFEFIDKYTSVCQPVTMMKTLRNFALLMWSKIKITLNLAAENIALRHQLAVMKRTNKRPKIRMTDRLFRVLLSRIWTGWRESLVNAKPDTVVRWHRKGFKLFGNSNPRGREGPALIVKSASLSGKWPKPIRTGARSGFTGNCSSWVLRFPNEPYRTSCPGARRIQSRLRRGEPS